MSKCIKCGSYAFNLYKEDIDQGELCDVHYWQDRAHKAEAKQTCEIGEMCLQCPDAKPKQEQGYKDGYEAGWTTALNEAYSKQEQGEPVGVAHLMQEGFTHCIWSEACVPVGTKFYTTPQQRKPLTDRQINAIWDSLIASPDYSREMIVRAIEAAHGIKE